MRRQYASALALAQQIRRGELTVPQLVKMLLSQPDRHGCYTFLNAEQAMSRAAAVQQKIENGRAVSPLAGVPLAVKDNICVQGMPTTCASKMLRSFVPPYSATVVQKAEAADMIVLGKLNMDEFAMGSTGETSCFGAVSNPYDSSRTAGGSSSGAAAAVAAGNALLALGSDTGGSVRQPCAYCGTVGLKPTYGAVSRYGLIAYASSLDTVGIVANTVADAAALFAQIKGKDEKDATSLESAPISLETLLGSSLEGKKIGLPEELFGQGVDEAIRERVLAAADAMKQCGAEVMHFSLPMLRYGVAAYYILACAEASANLARYDGVRYGHRAEGCQTVEALYNASRSEGFGYEVKKRILLGNFVLSEGYYDAYYRKALRAKQLLCEAYQDALSRYDFLLTPVTPTVAPKLGTVLTDPMKMYLSDMYTVTVNLTGLPALALPCGTDQDGLPIGLQLIGRPFDEQNLLGAGCAFERITL